jgi:hypothetical protein
VMPLRGLDQKGLQQRQRLPRNAKSNTHTDNST